MKHCATNERAVVARVVYKAKEGGKQSRKLLLLARLDSLDTEEPSALHIFEASWDSWERVPADSVTGWGDASPNDILAGERLSGTLMNEVEEVSVLSSCCDTL